MPGGKYRLLPASEAATQPVSQHLTLNYDDLFKIQRVQNPFPLRPVSFSRVAAYLECPACALEQLHKRPSAEPTQVTEVHQARLFDSGEPDPRLVDILLHEALNLLHAQDSPVEVEQQAVLLTSPEALARFLCSDLLSVLQASGKFRLALFFEEILTQEEVLQSTLLRPLFSYQRELRLTKSSIFAPAERFQLKLLSARNTFADHRDWEGYVGLVGEFDQIRLRNGGERPAILEFTAGLGKKSVWNRPLEGGGSAHMEPGESDELRAPGLAHAFQLAMYWLALQTRWDILEWVQDCNGQVDDLAMPFQQEPDLILYNLHDGCQYQLVLTDLREALLAVTNCLFCVNWAMKSGYSWQSPEHDCGKTQLLSTVPNPLIQVGSSLLFAEQCYRLARAAFRRFSEIVRWHPLPAEHAR